MLTRFDGSKGTLIPPATCRNSRLGQCVYCLRRNVVVTSDHVIARSFFPMSTPPDMAKWQVPACQRCNNSFSKHEQYVRDHLAATTNPTSAAAAGVWEASKRSRNWRNEKDPKQHAYKRRRDERLYRSLVDISSISPQDTMIESSLTNLLLGAQMAVRLTKPVLDTVIGKWVRGFHFIVHGRTLHTNAKFAVVQLSDVLEHGLGNVIARLGTLDGGPGLQIRHGTGQDEENRIFLCEFNIWGGVIHLFALVHEPIGP